MGRARCGARGVIVGILIGPARSADAIDGAELERRLLEMGFVEGARFEILHEGPIGRDPIAVKVDDTRVALRRRDADALDRRARPGWLGGMSDAAHRDPLIALVGNPNSGKTALFNALTGARQKVANYPGVTVEKKIGQVMTPAGHKAAIVDLPGTYSLRARSPDEAVTRDFVLGRLAGETPPDVIVCVADATNLRLMLRLLLELKQVGRPVVLALNMYDIAQRQGIRIDIEGMSRELGIPDRHHGGRAQARPRRGARRGRSHDRRRRRRDRLARARRPKRSAPPTAMRCACTSFTSSRRCAPTR